MAADECWCRVVVLGAAGEELATWVVSGAGDPDLTVVDGVCQLRLAALRAGAVAELRDVSARMAELLELAGLGGRADL